jgi:hypothetical protein
VQVRHLNLGVLPQVEILLSLQHTLCSKKRHRKRYIRDMLGVIGLMLSLKSNAEFTSARSEGLLLAVLLLHSPLKRYLYTSLRFFFGMSILSDAGRSSENASARGQLDSPCVCEQPWCAQQLMRGSHACRPS